MLGHTLQTIFGYVTFLVLNGTSSFGMKYIVLVPYIRLLTPWAKRPNPLAKYLVHISLFGPLMRWRNSCSTPVSGFRTAFASKLYICLAALAYRALLTAGCCCRRWRNGYRWLIGALLGGIFGFRGSAFGAPFWWFLFFTLGGVVVSGGIICTMFSEWFGGVGVQLSRSGFAVMIGIFNLGNFGSTLGGDTGGCFVVSVGSCCCGWTVAC